MQWHPDDILEIQAQFEMPNRSRMFLVAWLLQVFMFLLFGWNENDQSRILVIVRISPLCAACMIPSGNGIPSFSRALLHINGSSHGNMTNIEHGYCCLSLCFVGHKKDICLWSSYLLSRCTHRIRVSTLAIEHITGNSTDLGTNCSKQKSGGKQQTAIQGHVYLAAWTIISISFFFFSTASACVFVFPNIASSNRPEQSCIKSYLPKSSPHLCSDMHFRRTKNDFQVRELILDRYRHQWISLPIRT